MAVGPKRGPFRGPQPTRARLIQSATVAAAAAVALDWLSPLSTPPAHLVEPGLGAAWQQYHSGVTTPAETVDVDCWLRPLSEPVRTKPQITRGPVRAMGNSPFVAYVPSVLSEPVRVRAQPVRQGEYQTDWKPTTAFVYVPQALSTPVQVEPGLSAAWTQYFGGVTTPAVTAVTYIPPALSEPVRQKQGLPASQQQFFTTDTAQITDLRNGWLTPFSEPVRSKPPINQGPSFVTGNPPVVAYILPALSEPVRQKPGLGPVQQQFFATDTAQIIDLRNGWLEPFSEPVRSKPQITRGPVRATGHPPFVAYIPPALSEPVRSRAVPVRQGEYQTDWKPTAVVAAYVPAALSEPVQVKKSVPWQQPFAADTAQITDLRADWYQPFSEPVRSKPDIRWRHNFTIDAKWEFAVVQTQAWIPALSEPVRLEPGLGAAWQQYFGGVTTPTVTPAVVTYVPSALSEPVKLEPGLSAAWMQVSSVGAAVPLLDRYNTLGWLSEPVRVEPGLGAAWTQYHSGITVPADTSFYNWFSPLAEPVRVKPDIRWRRDFTIDAKWQLVVVQTQAWIPALSEPVRTEPGLGAAWQQYFGGVTTPTVTVVTYVPSVLSEPVKLEPGLSAAWMQVSSVGAADTLDRYNTFGWLSEPVRVEPGLGAAWTQYHSGITVPVAVVTTAYDWFTPLSEPVRTKPRAAWFQPYTMDWRWSPPVSNLVPGWHQWLSEPVRQKPGLHASRQQFFTMDWKWSVPVAVHYTYTLNTTESGDYGTLYFDGMSQLDITSVVITEIRVGNLAQVTTAPTPLGTSVTITEIKVGNSAQVTITPLDGE